MRIAVLFGGTSSERDVSIASGSEVVKALRARGHDVIAVDTAKGVLGKADENKLLTSGVATVPPCQESLDMLRGGDASAITHATEIERVGVVFRARHAGPG